MIIKKEKGKIETIYHHKSGMNCYLIMVLNHSSWLSIKLRRTPPSPARPQNQPKKIFWQMKIGRNHSVD